MTEMRGGGSGWGRSLCQPPGHRGAGLYQGLYRVGDASGGRPHDVARLRVGRAHPSMTAAPGCVPRLALHSWLTGPLPTITNRLHPANRAVRKTGTGTLTPHQPGVGVVNSSTSCLGLSASPSSGSASDNERCSAWHKNRDRGASRWHG